MRISETLRHLTPRELYIAHIAKGHVEDVIATIDMDAFLRLRNTARQRTKTLNAIKYFNLNGNMPLHMKRALGLGLNAKRGRSVLDVGTGFGYFPYICEYFGNTATAIDVPGHLLFDDVTNFLGVNKIHQRIEPFQPLTGLDRAFDLVTAFQVAFNRLQNQPWGEQEWGFFLDDLFKNVLKEHGELVMEMNYDPKHRAWVTPGARRAMKKYRARMFGARVHLSK